MKRGTELGLGPRHIVLDGNPAHPKKGHSPRPIFCPCLLWPNGGIIKMPLGMQVGLGPGHIVLDQEPALPPKKGHSPQFSAHVYCSQMARCIKMPLDMEVGICPGNDRDPAPRHRKKWAQIPIFGPCLLWPNSWMDQDATWYAGRPRPRSHCVRWGPNPLPKGAQPPNFQPMFVVDKWSPISATAVYL